ncbi:hypothetical protein HAX54_023822, partial [Datura stramonium]|nr:hypothetical protein [Datura stramonium]
ITFSLHRTLYGGQQAVIEDSALIAPVRYGELRPSPRSRCNGKSSIAAVPRTSSS